MLKCYVKAKSSSSYYTQDLQSVNEQMPMRQSTILLISCTCFLAIAYNILPKSKDMGSGPLNLYRETSLLVGISERL